MPTFLDQKTINNPNQQIVDDDFIWTDIAGLLDSGGDLISFINSFVNKKLFSIAHEVKFIIPITLDQIRDSRGQKVRDQIQVIQNVCHGCELNEAIKSIQPVITKVRQNDEDFDLDYIKSDMFEQFRNDLKQFEAKHNKILNADCSADPDMQMQQNKLKEQYKYMENFYRNFIAKLVVFDPLDRKIPEDFDMAIK